MDAATTQVPPWAIRAPVRGAVGLAVVLLCAGCQAEGDFQSLADAMNVVALLWIVIALLVLSAVVWWATHLKPPSWLAAPTQSTVDVDQIARDALLPRLPGFQLVSPSPFDARGGPSVLLYRAPIEDILVGVDLSGDGTRRIWADYIDQALFGPTDRATRQAVGMERDGFIRRFFRDRKWVLDGRHDAQVIDRLARYVVEEGVPILERRGALGTFADELMADEYERESDPVANEEAAYARILTGEDAAALEILEGLINMPGRGYPGETEISEDEMTALRDRARRMRGYLREDRQAALDQIASWRSERLIPRVLTTRGGRVITISP
jgi:hypothetical protein